MSEVIHPYGLSPERIKQLLECKPVEGYVMPKWPTPKPAKRTSTRQLKDTTDAIRNRRNQATWRDCNLEEARRRTREAMRRLRERQRNLRKIAEISPAQSPL